MTRDQFASGFEHWIQKKCKDWREGVANLFLQCVALVFNLVVAQKLLLVLVSLTWENMPSGSLHLQGPRLWEHRQIKLKFRNLTSSSQFFEKWHFLWQNSASTFLVYARTVIVRALLVYIEIYKFAILLSYFESCVQKITRKLYTLYFLAL